MPTPSTMTANDNDPSHVSRVTSRGHEIRDKYLNTLANALPILADTSNASNAKTDNARSASTWNEHSDQNAKRAQWVLNTAISLWGLALIANIWAIISAPVNSLHLAIVVCGLWASIAVSYTANKRGRNMLSETATLAALMAFSLSLYVTSLRFGLFIDASFGAGLTGFAALALSIALRSALCLRVSAVIAVAWVVLGVSSANINSLVWTMPILWLAQTNAASFLRDKPSVYLSALAGYCWIAALVGMAMVAGTVTPVMASLALFTAGVLHNRLGKLTQDQRGFAGLTHTNIGWAVFMLSLIALEWVWLSNGDMAGFGFNANAPVSAQWGLPIIAALTGVFAVEMRRAYTRPQTIFMGLMVTIVCVSFIFAALNADVFNALFTNYDFRSLPVSGLVLGGAVTALALVMTLNGFRRHALPMVVLGLLVISAQLIVSMESMRYSMESIFIFAMSTFIMGLLAVMFVTQHDDKKDA